MDHSRSKILPKELAREWIRFRQVGGDKPEIVLIRIAKNRGVQGFHRQKGADYANITNAQLMKKNIKGKKVFRARGTGDRGDWRITSEKLLYRFAPLEERGVFGAMVSSVIGNPVTYLFRGTLEERRTKRKVRGLFEVTLTNE